MSKPEQPAAPLALADVSFTFPAGAVILDRVSLTIAAASYLLLRGPSGAGKSTLLRLLCRLEEPQGGVISFRGNDIRELHPAELRARVALVLQRPTLIKGDVRSNLLLPFSFRANAALTAPDDDQLRDRLDRFLLDSIPLDRDARKLSVGQAQRLCLIRSLLLEPEVLLMDEPTAGLDTDSAAVVLAAAERLNRAGMTILTVSHADSPPPGISGALRIADGEVRSE